MMKHIRKPIDYLNDSPIRVLIFVGLPLLFSTAVQVLTILATNGIHSAFIGDAIFSVTGYLGAIISFFATVVSGLASAAWILGARYFAMHSKSGIKSYMLTAILAILLVTVVCSVVSIAFCKPILHLLHVPADFWADAKLYYTMQAVSLLPSALASFFLLVLTGTSNSRQVLILNTFSFCAGLAATAITVVLLKWGILGASLSILLGALLQLVVYIPMLISRGYFPSVGLRATAHASRWSEVVKILRYVSIIWLQNFLCMAGYLVVSMRTNQYLSQEYVSVINVLLPIDNAFMVLSNAITVFCPQNYAVGKTKRLKDFLFLSISLGLAYSVVCIAAYVGLGKWYFGRLFDDPVIVANGAQFWLWYSLGFPFLSAVCTVRYYLDAVGLSRFALLSGVGELIGNLICATWVIPRIGNVGRSIAYPVGWMLAAVLLFAAYFGTRKKIYQFNTAITRE